MASSRPPGPRGKPQDGGASAKQAQMSAFTTAPAPLLTTSQGLRIADNHGALKAGARGPLLAQDFVLGEKLEHFGRERIPERVVYARGCGAYGYFEVYQPMAPFTRAAFLQDPQRKTPVFARFSNLTGAAGSADTVRDVRGFAVKFYTDEGTYDLVGGSIPVALVQDPIKYPDLIHALKPEPHQGMPQASSAHDAFWDFVSLMPETTHGLLWLMSDHGLPRSLRMMRGFGVHTFRFISQAGEAHYVKFHWLPLLGAHALDWDEARGIAGCDPDFLRRDLWDAIAQGHAAEWELGVQMVPEARAQDLGLDLLDPTKLIPEALVPVRAIGRMVLDRNPDNFFAETEQAAFHPGHLVPGIALTNDPLLQGRLRIYTGAHFARLGGGNAHELPVNRALCTVHNFMRDGAHRQTVHRGRAAYEPNTLDLPVGAEMRVDGDALGYQEPPDTLPEGRVGRGRATSFDDHFSQATLFWNSQSGPEREHLVAALQSGLSHAASLVIRQRVVDNLAHVDMRLARKVALALGLREPDAQAAAGRAGFRAGADASGGGLVDSAGLSLTGHGEGSVQTRRVAVLVHDGVDAATLRLLLPRLDRAGVACTLLGPRLGSVATLGRRRLDVAQTMAAQPSVLFDAVFVAGGAGCVQALGATDDAPRYLREAYRHGKPLCAVDEGAGWLLSCLGLSTTESSPEEGVAVGQVRGLPEAVEELAQAFLRALARHRYWTRGGSGGHLR